MISVDAILRVLILVCATLAVLSAGDASVSDHDVTIPAEFVARLEKALQLLKDRDVHDKVIILTYDEHQCEVWVCV